MRQKFLLSLIFLLGLGGTAFAEPQAVSTVPHQSTPAPQRYVDEIEYLSRDGGRWVADNSAYKSENEPMESYVLEWRKSYANSATGRLFGMVDGKETGTFWEFKQYWHPGKAEAVVEQFGLSGVVGIGRIWHEDGKTKTEQVMYVPDGSAAMLGHIQQVTTENEHTAESYDIVDGKWVLNRTYVWKRAADQQQ